MDSPDSYIKFDGNVFFQAVRGLPPYIAIGYLAAIWYYVHHNHCKGLKDNDDFLRRLCEIVPEQWPEARRVIFDDNVFFVKQKGLWHQKRARADYNQAEFEYNKKRKAGQSGARARWAVPGE
jgi:hypothetical protein